MKKVVVCLPVYNEGKRVERTISNIVEFLCGEKKYVDWKLLLVDDGSTDESAFYLSEATKKFPDLVNTITHDTNLGYGAANFSGMQWCLREDFDYCIYMDADQTQDPTFLNAVSNLIFKGYDVIKATRYIAGAKVIGVPLSRRLISRVGNMLARVILTPKITDFTNGFRAIKVVHMKDFKPKDSGFSYILEEASYLSTFPVINWIEFPYTLTNRPLDGKQSAFRYHFHTYINYLKHLL